MSFFPKEGGGIFKQGAFQIDPNTTPEMLDRKREMLAAMMPRYGRARYIGEGIGQLGTAIASNRQNSAMDKFEGEQRQQASGIFNNVMSGQGAQAPRSNGPLSILGMREGGQAAQPNPMDAKYPVGQDGPAPQGNIDPASGLNMGQAVSAIPEPVKNGIFAGESGGDYNALFGFQNREGGKYSNVKLTDMSIDQALDFANPQGEYGQWVKGQVGRVATPMGAYQIVGTTLREAKNALGLTGNEKMTTELQDQLGAWIYKNQGTGAWEGYKGPQDSFAASGGQRVAQNGGGYQQPQNDGRLNDLMMAAQNPWLSTQQRQVVNSQIQQLQGQQQAMQQRQWGREDDAYNRAQDQADPLYQLKLRDAQAPKTQFVKGIGLINSVTGKVVNDFGGADGALGGIDPAHVQSSSILADGSTVMVMKDGTRLVRVPTGEVVEGADAAAAIKVAREYEVQNQQDIYSGRRTGTNVAEASTGGEAAYAGTAGNLQAEIDLGGAAEAAKDLGAASMAAGVGAWESYGKMQTSLGNIDNAIAAIDSGAKSGVIYNMLPSVTEASASLENSMNRMGLDIVGAVTFGALSEGELRLAMNTAVPQNLGPADLRSWLVKRKDAQAKAAAMISDAAQYLTNPENNLNGWIEKNRQARSAGTTKFGNTPPPEANGGGSAAATHVFNPATGKVEPVK